MYAFRRRALASIFATGLLVHGAGGWAQTAADGSYAPSSGQAGKDVVWLPTPDRIVDRMLQMAEVKPSDLVVDLGSGDGKITIAAARNHGARAVGLEFNPDLVKLAQRRAQQAGVADKVVFREADVFAADFSDATVVTMYLLPRLNLRLRPKLFTLAPGTRIVSHSFDMGDWQPDEQARAGTGQLFLWTIPANASGHWRLLLAGMPDAPRVLRLTQTFQMLAGEARFEEAGLVAAVVRPHLAGQALTFGVRDAAGTLLQFSARVSGSRMTGTVKRGDGAPAPFEAERSETPAAIGGVQASEEEMLAATRVLGTEQ